jgi:hypothetical protein
MSPGSYSAGDTIPIQITFSGPVTVDPTNGTPQLQLNSGGAATYTSGSGTNVLTFTYVVRSGDSSPLLDYTNSGALNLRAGLLLDADLTGVDPTLPAPGAPGSLESSAALTVRGTSPRIISSGATVQNDKNPNQIDNATNVTYGANKPITIALNFNDVVQVTGTPRLLLNTTGGPSGVATYAGGSGGSQLVFIYTTAAGQSTPRLDYTSLDLNGGTLTDATGHAFVPTLPAVGGAGSLSSTNKIAIAADQPTVVSVYSAANGTFGTGEGVLINVTFNRPVQLTKGQAQLLLKTTLSTSGGQQGFAITAADLDLTAFRTTYQFTYTVLDGQNTPQLDYRDVASLVLATGANFVDTYGNNASLALVPPGTAGSLGYSNRIVIRSNAAVPVVTAVSAAVPSGTYGVGAVIPVTVSFSGKVNVSTASGTPQLKLALDNNQTALVNYTSGSGTNTLTFNYTVAAGQNAQLLAYASAAALSPDGTITDATTGADASRVLPTPGTVGSLSGTRRLVIDTATPAPSVVRVSAAAAPGTYRTGAVILVRVTFSGPVVVTPGTGGLLPQLVLTTGPAGQTTNVNYVSGSGSNTLTFRLTVTSTMSTPLLGYAPGGALKLNGATIRDARASRDAMLGLPDPGLDGSLSSNSLILLNLP